MTRISIDTPIEKGCGTILSVTRRSVHILVDGKVKSGVSSTSARELTPGDSIEYTLKGDEIFVDSLRPRRNLFARSYRDKTKLLAANLDHLYLVSSVRPLFHTIFVDRVLAVARNADIPASFIVNKSDLGLEKTHDLIEIYQSIGIPILFTSAKKDEGLNILEDSLANPAFSIVALAGVSGVGKSTLLNKLVPEAERRTGEVSSKTGQGRQTTTQSVGYQYHSSARERDLIIIDLPGVQNFGVSHLSLEQISYGFVEIDTLSRGCEFDNCSHAHERKCAVRSAAEALTFAPSRYESYLRMREEVEAAKPY